MCPHPAQQGILQKLYYRLANELNVSEETKEMISNTIINSAKDQGWRPKIETRDNILRKGIEDQSRIGWHQVLYGRMAKAFVVCLASVDNLSNPCASSETHGRKLIRAIWDTFLLLWQQWNEVVHGTTLESRKMAETKALEMKVNQCYECQYILPINDRQRIFQTSREDKLQEEPRNIKSWIRMANRIIQTNKQELKKEQGQRKLMENYFKWNPPDQRRHHNNTSRKQHRKHNLKPD
jgi:hypothetical protein